MEPIIKSIDDTDIYKKYMQYFLIKQGLGNYVVKYEFFNRGETKFTKEFLIELRNQIQHLSKLKWETDQLLHLQEKCPFFDNNYIWEFLPTCRFNPESITVDLVDGDLQVTIQDKVKYAIDWEVTLMALISELQNRLHPEFEKRMSVDRTQCYKTKFEGFKALNAKVAEFGTRRRASYQIQSEMLKHFINVAPNSLLGTSNIALGRKHNLPLIGTIAHEVYMIYAALYGVLNANKLVTRDWRNLFPTDLHVALPDTFTTEFFLKTFDWPENSGYHAIRQDSMEPKKFVDLILSFYKEKGIDARNKKIIFSDNINSLELMEEIISYTKGKINCSFGIGTWLSNDCEMERINMVIKITQILKGDKWLNCVKLSDVNGKITGNRETAYSYLKLIENADREDNN